MDIERIDIVVILMLPLLSFLNIIGLHGIIKKIKNKQENADVIKRYKKKWSLIVFTDLLFFLAFLFILLLIISDILYAYFLSFFLAYIYMTILGIRIEKEAEKVFGNDYIQNKNIKKMLIKPEYRSKENDNKTINTVSYDQENLKNMETVETRKLTISRKRAFAASLVKIFVFIETDDFSVNDISITLEDNKFKQIGKISYGKTLDVFIPIKSVKIMIATFLSNNLQNYMFYSILPGSNDVILNVKPMYPHPSKESFNIEQVM